MGDYFDKADYSPVKHSYGVQLLFIILGIVLIVTGYVIPPDHILTELYLHETAKVLGTLLIGLGFSSIYEVYTQVRNDNVLRRLLSDHIAAYPEYTRGLLLDHIGTNDNLLDIPERYRQKVYIYHQTGANIDGDVKTVWVLEEHNFSGEKLRKVLLSTQTLADPRPGFPDQIYKSQLTLANSKLVITMNNETDGAEVAAVYLFDAPVLSPLSYGIFHHMDWEGNLRISRAIFSLSELPIDPKNAGKELDEMWLKTAGQQYTITL